MGAQPPRASGEYQDYGLDYRREARAGLLKAEAAIALNRELVKRICPRWGQLPEITVGRKLASFGTILLFNQVLCLFSPKQCIAEKKGKASLPLGL